MKRVLLLLVFPSFLFAATPSDQVRFTLPPPERPKTDTTVRLFAELTNTNATVDATNLTVDVEVRGGPYVGGESTDRWSCANHQSPFKLRCTAAMLRAGETLKLQVYIGPATEGNFEVQGFVTWKVGEEEFGRNAIPQSARFERVLNVTHANDSGEGSLRAAIEALNGVCRERPLPCDVRVGIAGDQPRTIVLDTPLPTIESHDFRIYGPVVIDGSKLGAGHGLHLRGNGPFVIDNVTVRGFPWDGLAIARTSSIPDSTFLANNTAEHNGSRGITFDGAGNLRVTGNRAAGNARSGFFLSGGYNVRFEGNLAEDNGASGMFIGPGANYVFVERNRVARNAQFGIAVDRRAAMVTLTDNSIAGNGLLGIDRGLDGFNGYAYDDYDTNNAKIPPPRLTAATYDRATDTTIITGTYFDAKDHWGTWSITVYSNDVPGPHADVILGHPVVSGGAFTLTVPGDLRGRYITASGNRYLNLGWSGAFGWPSEISEHVEVH